MTIGTYPYRDKFQLIVQGVVIRQSIVRASPHQDSALTYTKLHGVRTLCVLTCWCTPVTFSTAHIIRQELVDIKDLLRLEDELQNPWFWQRWFGSATRFVGREAKLNLLKYLQIRTVLRYEGEYDSLQHELSREGGLDCLRSIARFRSQDLLQPKVLAPQDCDKDDQLKHQLDFYLVDAQRAKQHLDWLVAKVVKDLEGCEVQYVEVKSLESTQRKASNFCGGDVRKVTDMARVAVICDTPEALTQAYMGIVGYLQVSRVYLVVRDRPIVNVARICREYGVWNERCY